MNPQGVAGTTWRGADRWPVAVGALVVLVSRVLTLPRTLWESDEFLFVQAVARFEMRALADYCRLNEERGAILDDVRRLGRVYAR